MTNTTQTRTTKRSADRTTSRLQDIAESVGFPRTEKRSDRLDFNELHVNTLLDALRQAYEMGRADERKARRHWLASQAVPARRSIEQGFLREDAPSALE